MILDQRYVYGAVCTWHGSINDTKTTAPMSLTLERKDGTKQEIDSRGVPCCPHCGGVLMQYASIAEWKASASKWVAANGLAFNVTLEVYYGWLEWLVRIEDGKQVKCSRLEGWYWKDSFAQYRRELGV